MKKLFLVILAGGLIFTACKKDEKETPSQTNLSQSSWKTSDWVLTKTNVKINGTASDEYTNKQTSQVVYEALEDTKEVVYTRYYEYVEGVLKCPKGGTTCAEAIIDGQAVYILKRPPIQ